MVAKTHKSCTPSMTWLCVMSSPDVSFIEDPISGSFLPKSVIGMTYPKTVCLLNGRDAVANFDLFFQQIEGSPTTWELCDQDARDDCLDMIRMMGEA